MQQGISSLSFSGTLKKKIEAAAEARFDGIEIFCEDLVFWDGAPSDVGKFAAEAGIEILSLQSLRNFDAAPEDKREWNLKRAERYLDLAAGIGAPLLIVTANTQLDTIDDDGRVANDLAVLADMAANKGLRVGYEALSTSRHVRTYTKAWNIIKKADRPNLGLVIGYVHTFAAGAEFSDLMTIDPERIFLVHLADAPAIKMDARIMSRHFRLFPGQGDLPVGDFFNSLENLGYDGPVSIEIFNDQVRTLPAKRIADDGVRAYQVLSDSTDAQPVVNDVGFVEFTCQDKDAKDLKRFLEGLGFVCTHRHRSKDVSLYHQGEINLVINEEKDGPAHSFYLLHGLSVCALGFQVENPAKMIERSQLFHGGSVTHLAKSNELDIPAIRSPGGSMIFFLNDEQDAPKFYEIDFERVTDSQTLPKTNLRAVDHYSQVVMPTEFLSSLLYYRAMFGFKLDEQVDIIDPHGTVRSRNISNGNGHVQFSLNASLGACSMTQRFLAKNILSAYQHFAFSCDDIFAFAKTLDQDLVLQIPDNYYDDLLLRFNIDPSRIDEMKEHKILYDRNEEGGEYFQLFTRDINGMFLEIVQRDGYSGFGADNASVRIAAQARDYEKVQNMIIAMDYN